METTDGRIVAMASYPNYNPSVWTSGISQQEVNYLFGLDGQTKSGEPAVNWATQGQYAPGSTFKVTSTAAAVADGFPLHGQYNCPASVNIAGHKFDNDGEASQGDMSFSEALIQSCDTVYYDIGYQMWKTDNNKANFTRSANAPDPEDAGDGAGLGLRQDHRRGPARGLGRQHPHPPVALQPVGGQRPQGPELVRERQGSTAPTSSRSSTRTARTAGSGSRARRPSRRSARAT